MTTQGEHESWLSEIATGHLRGPRNDEDGKERVVVTGKRGN